MVYNLKKVKFDNDELLAIEEGGKIYVGVSYICRGIGFSKSQKDTQVQKVKNDTLLSIGCKKFQAGVFDDNNETLAIELDFLPMWLAKVNITPTIIEENPILAENLLRYQLKAKDVLAEAFVNKKHRVPQNMKEALLIALEQQEEIERLELENSMQKQEIETNKPKVDYYNTILADTTSLLSVTQIAKDYNLTAVALNKILKENKIQYKQSNQWLLYAEHLDKGFVKSVTHLVDGRPFLNTKWTQRGRIFIHELLSKLGIKAAMDTQEIIF